MHGDHEATRDRDLGESGPVERLVVEVLRLFAVPLLLLVLAATALIYGCAFLARQFGLVAAFGGRNRCMAKSRGS